MLHELFAIYVLVIPAQFTYEQLLFKTPAALICAV